MTVQLFRDLLAARPFNPFRLVASSGSSCQVRHPEMSFLSRTAMYVGVDVADSVPAAYRITSFLHVNAVEPVTIPAGA